MFADFARKSIAVCVSSINVFSETSPFGRGEGAIVATCLTIKLRQNRVKTSFRDQGTTGTLGVYPLENTVPWCG